MEKTQCSFQLGKQGISTNFIKTLKIAFTTHKNVRVCVLKSGGREKQKIKEYREKILEDLGKNFTARIVGFTIFVKKWRKPMRG
jgi:RNA-binding protein YhbY